MGHEGRPKGVVAWSGWTWEVNSELLGRVALPSIASTCLGAVRCSAVIVDSGFSGPASKLCAVARWSIVRSLKHRALVAVVGRRTWPVEGPAPFFASRHSSGPPASPEQGVRKRPCLAATMMTPWAPTAPWVAITSWAPATPWFGALRLVPATPCRGFRRPHGLWRPHCLWRPCGIRRPHGLRQAHESRRSLRLWRPRGLRLPTRARATWVAATSRAPATPLVAEKLHLQVSPRECGDIVGSGDLLDAVSSGNLVARDFPRDSGGPSVCGGPLGSSDLLGATSWAPVTSMGSGDPVGCGDP